MEDSEKMYIQDQIGYKFENVDLLEQAFTRKSYTEEFGTENNEILEFAGDKIIDFVVTKRLLKHFGGLLEEYEDLDSDDLNEFVTDDGVDEGYLTRMRARFVSGKNLAKEIERMELKDFLYMGTGDEKCNAQNQQSVKEDLFEAIVGAVAVDSGWDMEKLETVVDMMLNLELNLNGTLGEEEDYVILFQKWHQKRFGTVPKYDIRESYFGQNRYRATLNSCLGSFYYHETGEGTTKSEARYNLARKIYNHLSETNQIATIREELGIDDLTSDEHAVNILQELSQKGYCSTPKYQMSEKTEYRDGKLWWDCTCSIDSCRDVNYQNPFGSYQIYPCKPLDEVIGSATSKKEAKRYAAYLMLCQIFDLDDVYEDED